jgi:hypothetical protein
VPNFGHSAKSGTCLAKIGGGQTASSAVLFAKCLPFGTQQSNGKFFFCFLAPNFFEALLPYHKQHVKIWHIFIAFWYISLVYFVLLNFFRIMEV